MACTTQCRVGPARLRGRRSNTARRPTFGTKATAWPGEALRTRGGTRPGAQGAQQVKIRSSACLPARAIGKEPFNRSRSRPLPSSLHRRVDRLEQSDRMSRSTASRLASRSIHSPAGTNGAASTAKPIGPAASTVATATRPCRQQLPKAKS